MNKKSNKADQHEQTKSIERGFKTTIKLNFFHKNNSLENVQCLTN
jgi:hypothetical protein